MHVHVETRKGTLPFAIDVAQPIVSLDQFYLTVTLSFSADLESIDTFRFLVLVDRDWLGYHQMS